MGFLHCETGTGKKQKIVSLLLAAAVIIVVLCSSFYIAVEADHDCTGEDCPICTVVQQCENTVRLMSDGTAAQMVSLFFAAVLFPVCVYTVPLLVSSSLITSKVRLND